MKSIPSNPTRSVALRRKHEAEISAEFFQMSAEKARTFEARTFAHFDSLKICSRFLRSLALRDDATARDIERVARS